MERDKKEWWPFSTNELQTAFGVYGFLASLLAFSGLEPRFLAWCSIAFLVLAYTAGLLVHAKSSRTRLELIPHGGVAGAGHIEPFRKVKRCLFLMHMDDDPPSEELLGLYRRLLDDGIAIRRIIFLRPEASLNAYSWVTAFGDHPGLQHRVVLPDQTLPVRFSFAVVDDSTVIMSVPGWEAIDGKPYETHLVLRHLMVIRDETIARVFQSMHQDIWNWALPLKSVAELDSRDALLRRCERNPAA